MLRSVLQAVNLQEVINKLDHADISEVDPHHVHIDIRVFIPNVALDLYYNVVEGDHLMFAIDTLQTHIVIRPHDLQVLCRFSALSIQDSLRSVAQQNLLKTLSETLANSQVRIVVNV